MIHHRQSSLQVARCWLRIKELILNDAVNPLSHAIVRRIAIFGHTDAYMVRFELRNVIIAAILHAAIGMMDCAAQVASSE